MEKNALKCAQGLAHQQNELSTCGTWVSYLSMSVTNYSRRNFVKLCGGALGSCMFLRKSQGATSNTDCIVVGAGVSGLAAADYIRKRGWEVTILEARERIGGRVWSRKDWLGNSPVDIGASWIHGISENPISGLALQAGFPLMPFDYGKSVVYNTGGSELSQAQESRLQRDFKKTLRLSKEWAEKQSTDPSLRESFKTAEETLSFSRDEITRINFRAHTEIEHEFAASMEQLSAQWWDEGKELIGGDAFINGGLTTIFEPLARGLDIRFGQSVIRVVHNHDGVSATTSQGLEIRAKKIILTVPLGILKKGSIVFEPPLPEEKDAAIRRIGFGNYQKTVLLYDQVFWNKDLHMFDWNGGAKGNEWAEWANLYPFTGEPALIAFNTAEAALAIESMTDSDIAKAATEALSSALGKRTPPPKDILVSRWGHDPCSLGAYSFMGVGATPRDRVTLGKPIGRSLHFAGEAVSKNYPATMRGAYESGLAAAKQCLGDANSRS
ncbi:MAG: FAD-dependent oxidoreductase [Chthoniobacterales bacterium]